MKTLIKSLALALTLGFVTSAALFAETNPGGRPTTVAAYKTGIYTTHSGKLTVALDKEMGGSVDIRLKDANGSVLYSQHLGKNEQSYRTRLNLNELGDGIYQLEITNGVDTTVQNVTISTQFSSASSRVISVR